MHGTGRPRVRRSAEPAATPDSHEGNRHGQHVSHQPHGHHRWGEHPPGLAHRRRSGAHWCGAGDQAFSITRAGYRRYWFGSAPTATWSALGRGHRQLWGRPQPPPRPGRSAVWEVTGPDTAQWRGRGTDDTLDAIAAARAALTDQRVSVAKDCCGAAAALRVLCNHPKDRGPLPASPAIARRDCRHRVAPCDRDCPLDTARTRCLWHAGGTAGEHDDART